MDFNKLPKNKLVSLVKEQQEVICNQCNLLCKESELQKKTLKLNRELSSFAKKVVRDWEEDIHSWKLKYWLAAALGMILGVSLLAMILI